MHYKTRGMLNRSQRRLRSQEAAENAAYYGDGGPFENIMGGDVIDSWKRDQDYMAGDKPKAVWRVVAGASPDELDPQFERSWVYSLREHHGDLFRSADGGLAKFDQRLQEITDYMVNLNRHPTKARFVRCDFLWI